MLHLGPTPYLLIRVCALTRYGLGPLPPPTPERLAPCAQAMNTLLTEARVGQCQSLVISSTSGPPPGPAPATLAPGILNAAPSRNIGSKLSSCFPSLRVGVGEALLLAMQKF